MVSAVPPDFEITLKPSSQTSPFNKNSELDKHLAGRLWMANDGGVYWCDDGGRNEHSWQMPTGLETLDPVNIAGLFGNGNQPALYFGWLQQTVIQRGQDRLLALIRERVPSERRPRAPLVAGLAAAAADAAREAAP